MLAPSVHPKVQVQKQQNHLCKSPFVPTVYGLRILVVQGVALPNSAKKAFWGLQTSVRGGSEYVEPVCV